jgi:hypothetical protein
MSNRQKIATMFGCAAGSWLLVAVIAGIAVLAVR